MKKLVIALLSAIFYSAWSVAATGAPSNFAVHESPKPVSDIRFEDGEGNDKTLADFRGKAVLLNVWATWCLPCREEMPTLDRLQAKLGGPDFEVLALSMDRAGPDAVRRFFSEIGIENLALYIDPSAKSMFALGVVGLPTTILIDGEGRELGRLVGPAEWDSPEMAEFIRSKITRDRAKEMK
ncbi:TlpA family protein disulfide reductase [Manganibacter manganicus]|uniref:Redoxin n=1 Tax=Manganibacter manganicus TaxID=1873176 RepID=A0A1V8RR22_9HYPH|nr:TlpA disulfide reductase family protein [Pseudaminobacter manganicus]OQM75662.1 redoxin [Pseudaminobacter manganicus]